MRFSVWLEVQVSLFTKEWNNYDDAVDHIRAQGEHILDRIERVMREERIGDPLYLTVSDVKLEEIEDD